MIVLSANHLSKVYGTDVIIEGASFHVNNGDRVGIIGRNGAGKTTLLNMLTGELPYDEGGFFVSQDVKIGYLKQRDPFSDDETVVGAIEKIFRNLKEMEREIARLSDEVAKHPEEKKFLHRLYELQQEYEEKGGYTYKSEIKGVLTSMAFGEDTFGKKVATLSGGEKTRLALAALLLEKPDLLLLDEPTNHLDIGTLKWLEQYLSQYKGTILLISHDRYFLDQVVNRIFEVENHKVTCYNGKYSDFAEQKRLLRLSQMRAYEKQQKELRRQEDMIRMMKGHKTEKLVKRAQSREKRLSKIERIERPEAEMGKMKIQFKQNFQSGNDVILAEDLSKGFGWGDRRRQLFRQVSLDIKKGEKICIVGANGVGKTTLLRILLGELETEGGRLKIGHNVDFGYYDQGQLLLNGNNTVFEEMKESYRLYKDSEMRAILGRFLFKGEDVFLRVDSLSGGEKARLSLAKLMLSGANTLILDEPTNHLDIESKEVIEEAISDFPGTAIIVSHDRYFLQKIPTRILELTQEGIREYLGKYDYYLEKKEEIHSSKKYVASLLHQDKDMAEKEILTPAMERALKKQEEAEERRKRRALEQLERQIDQLEREIDSLEKEMCREDMASDFEALQTMSKEHREKVETLENAYEEWEQIGQ